MNAAPRALRNSRRGQRRKRLSIRRGASRRQHVVAADAGKVAGLGICVPQTMTEIKVWNVKAWIDAIQENRVVLPMIQRGSVWKPHQFLDLWDTLLQGMPPGALMASPVGPEAKVLDLRTRKMVLPPPNAIALLDGQQRTLAMLGVLAPMQF